ncbi:hypothetical protein FOH10_09265 [Nocardia otitidiscaviarum]|uniref:DUF5655 domain-containing protein n=1 Tax=Nocardia otitidiscaviarum TaxID=1823 RepID=A0A516NJ19_9NOCA|nr:DUF5655 domain-containing protein [Nocardia otitidiscaviarum]MCP9619656.1 DUF5655 domain-containing protein [Nocardia otitidiscaviarum]QDP78898.1 hypothetical protein FOH10_09265 [Nocardia otitidiscaviarum]
MAVAQGIAEFFDGDETGARIAEAVRAAIAAAGAAEMRISKSQIGFRRGRAFAQVWRPGRYVRSDVPAVLTIELPYRMDSPRFKEVAHPATAHWTHHLELREPDQVDDEVRGWLAEAYENAG